MVCVYRQPRYLCFPIRLNGCWGEETTPGCPRFPGGTGTVQFVAPPDTGTRKQWNNNEYPPLLWVFQGQIGRQKGGRAVQHPCGIGAKCLCSIWKYQRVIFWGSNTEVLRTYQVRPTIAWLLRGFAPLIRHVVKGVVTSGYSRRKREYLNVPGTTAKTSIYGTLTPQSCNVSP